MNCRAACSLLLAGALAGCSVGPEYHRPKLDIPTAYTSPRPDVPKLPVRPDWWRGFAAPELDQLIELAWHASPDLAAATARVVQADQAARIAGSPLLPGITGGANQNWQLTGNAGQSTTTLSRLFTGAGNQRYTETRTYAGTISASYEVDFWGKNRDAFRAAEAAAQASRYDRETVWLTTATSIATTYFQAIGDRDRLAIARNNLSSAQDLLNAYQARLQVGTASALDVSQQEALVAGYKAQLPALESSYRQEVIALSILVGLPPEQITLDTGTLVAMHLPAVASGVPADVLRQRPDVAYAEAELISQNQTVRQDFADFFPSLTLTAAGGVSSLALSAITGPGSLAASLANSLSQTIFDNGLKSGTLGQAKGRYQELAADYAKAVLQALSDVETALTQTTFSAEQEALEADAVAKAQHSLDIVHAQLSAGTVDITTVLNTETTLFNDQDALAQVRIARFLAQVSLYKSLGGGWELPPAPANGVPAVGGPTAGAAGPNRMPA
jgi:NodT family efflux transporter outer membrane factor (OMF) lipoprotein